MFSVILHSSSSGAQRHNMAPKDRQTTQIPTSCLSNRAPKLRQISKSECPEAINYFGDSLNLRRTVTGSYGNKS